MQLGWGGAMSDERIALNFDAAVYRLTAVKKAAYKFGDRCLVEIEATPDQSIRVRIGPKGSAQLPEGLVAEFRNEVLDQDLRETIAEETGDVRNLLLAQAFSAVSLTDRVGETANATDDPIGIRQSQAGNC